MAEKVQTPRKQGAHATQAPDLLRVALTNARLTILVIGSVFGFLFVGGFLSATLAILGFGGIVLAATAQAYVSEDRRRRAEARIISRRASETTQSGIGSVVLQQMPDAVVLLDGAGRIVFHNRAAEQFVGQVAVGKLIQSTLREPAVLDALQRVQGQAPAETVEFMRSFPVERHFQVFVSPAQGATEPVGNQKEGTAILLVLHDISDTKRVEQMRVDFVANASHELKTPLASLSGFIETLQGPAKDDVEAHERFLVIMGEQTLRMQRLIEDLLSLSRIELREHLPPKDIVSLEALTRDVVEAIEPITTRDEVDVFIDFPSDLPSVKGDWDELHQVVQNLVDNAVKYGRNGKRVEVTAESAPDGAGVKLSVRDFGPGIPREHIPRLTERFYRIDVATSRERGGTGLGLAIVKHILNRHGGELNVESTVGEGSIFTIQLPVSD